MNINSDLIAERHANKLTNTQFFIQEIMKNTGLSLDKIADKIEISHEMAKKLYLGTTKKANLPIFSKIFALSVSTQSSNTE